MDLDALTAAGLGLEYADLRLERVRDAWAHLGADLAAEVAATLGPRAVDVVHIGSTSVPGFLAKPILDLAVGTAGEPELEAAQAPLEGAGWIYRGDAGTEGGLVFVLESRPWHRVAHVHVVEHEGRQWRDYLALQARLRQNAAARDAYAATKAALIAASPADRTAYQAGKHDTVASILTDEPPR